jgi:RHS repeat-associated protein
MFSIETKQSYYRARYYDASAGRFVGEDPAKWSGDNLNFYAYAQNRPTLMVDPLGLLAEVYCERRVPQVPPFGTWVLGGIFFFEKLHNILVNTLAPRGTPS